MRPPRNEVRSAMIVSQRAFRQKQSSNRAREIIAFHRQHVAVGQIGVNPKSAAFSGNRRHLRRRAVRSEKTLTVVFPEDPVKCVLPDLAAILCARNASIQVSAARLQEKTLSIPRTLGDDIDDPIDRVRPPEARTGAANYLDLRNIVKRYVLRIPENACD